ncbi:unnamed protein product [Rhizoctonia solani]|uniref:Zn(2)-C6 fungal-type domain-containing protein n=1 Tax=Rhizoctonia solani TaxID=456999 RepID=A0A8H3DWQ8_9AGAM|nr:unnamed protein product [Rhizoctonia solani]
MRSRFTTTLLKYVLHLITHLCGIKNAVKQRFGLSEVKERMLNLRKKCDEKSPVCSRCEKGDSECIWPQHSIDPAPSTLDVFLGEQIAAGLEFSTPAGFGATSISESSFGPSYFLAQTGSLLPIEITPPATDTRFEDLIARDSDSESTLSPRSDQTGFLHTSTSSESHSLLASTHSKHLLKNWEYAQDYGPRIIWSSFGPSYFIAQTGLHLPIEIIPPATDTRFEDLIARDSDSGSTLSPRSDHDQTGFLRGVSAPNNSTSSETHSLLASTHSKHLLKNWEYAQDYGPRIIWPPNDLEEVHDFDPEEVMPTLYKSIDSLTRTAAIEPVFNEILHFWSTFLSRVFYDYTIFPESIAGWMLQRFKMSDSAKYGMLATAVLFRANYEISPSTNFLRDHARELHSLASRQISLDLKNNEMSPQVKLAGLIEVTNYEYYSSTLSRYYPHVLEAASIVRQIIGGDTLDLLSLSGMHTFDVRCFAWCDILHSMATSRPTMLKYESNIKQAQQPGYEDGYSNPDKGVEWIYGCPGVLTVLMARITALKHSPTSKEEIVRQGTILEESILNWEFQPTQAKGSVMRVARVGVQEVWRHVATLYLHQVLLTILCSYLLKPCSYY